MLHKNKTLISGSLLLAVVLLSACGEKQQAMQGQTPQVTVVTLASEPVTLTRQLPGRTSPSKVAEVRPQVDGLVKEQLFKEGGMVEAGSPLYQLDAARYQADYDGAKASLERAEATLNVTRLKASRTKDLVKSGAVSKQDNDTAIASLHQAKADVAAAKAAVARSKVMLEFARIRAPISGRIGISSVTQGALVTANQSSALATVQQLDPIYVDLTQSVSELLNLRQSVASGDLKRADNLPVTILLEDGSQYPHAGRLEFSEVSVDPTTGSVRLRVVVPNPDHLLLPGMYVRAAVGSGQRDDAILVPQQGIARDPKGNTTAMVVGEGNTVELRPVRVSQTVGSNWLVESGLKVGDRVIVEGLQKIRPGAVVSPGEAEAPAPVDLPAPSLSTAGHEASGARERASNADKG
ncbi:efflux RND transporter periplasmic adaptor subunit [Microbulbifer hydrolyticus]|uniref:Efflux RND transporter periplasmic adaptor subunit n=1 Tax=Microbulbifer hydrolyticus TaxID=48074 RepID=A0A6P1TCT9_9GAMM|nr:efflux RND transporter periplasmic adaptor subunit [Microbulbifer hydrolyticus]MBB5210437.1 membrane fusion protein (multidrug efflux system) [Microbulbifer hydrolyticus]QHQ39079.1 efflux RND transporter periplasmic adaptor subunit [Microbulbifer hydrolyticus]